MDQASRQQQNALPHSTVATPSQLCYDQQPPGLHRNLQEQDALARRPVWMAVASPSADRNAGADASWTGTEGTSWRPVDAGNVYCSGPSAAGFQVSETRLGIQGAAEQHPYAGGTDEGARRTGVGRDGGRMDVWSAGAGEGYGFGQKVQEWPPLGWQQLHHQHLWSEGNGGEAVGRAAQRLRSSPSGGVPAGDRNQLQHQQDAYPYHDNLHPHQPQQQQQQQQVQSLHEQGDYGTAYHISAQAAAQPPSQPLAVSHPACTPHHTEGPLSVLPYLPGGSAFPEPTMCNEPSAVVLMTGPAARDAAPASQQLLPTAAAAAAAAAAAGGGDSGAVPTAPQQATGFADPSGLGSGLDPSGLGSGVRAVARDLSGELQAAQSYYGAEAGERTGAHLADGAHLGGSDARTTWGHSSGLASSMLPDVMLSGEGGRGDGCGVGVCSGGSSAGGGSARRAYRYPELSRLLAAGRGGADAALYGSGGCDAVHGQDEDPGGVGPHRQNDRTQQQQVQQDQHGRELQVLEEVQQHEQGYRRAHFERLVPPTHAQRTPGMGSCQEPLSYPHPLLTHEAAASDRADQRASLPQTRPVIYPDARQRSTQGMMHDVGIMTGEDCSGSGGTAAHALGAAREPRTLLRCSQHCTQAAMHDVGVMAGATCGAAAHTLGVSNAAGTRLAPSLVRVTAASASAPSTVSYPWRSAAAEYGHMPYPTPPGPLQGDHQQQHPRQHAHPPPLPQQHQPQLQQPQLQHQQQQRHVQGGSSPWALGTSRGSSTMATPEGSSGPSSSTTTSTSSSAQSSSSSTIRSSRGSLGSGFGGSSAGGAAGNTSSSNVGTYQQHQGQAPYQSPTRHSYVAIGQGGGAAAVALDSSTHSSLLDDTAAVAAAAAPGAAIAATQATGLGTCTCTSTHSQSVADRGLLDARRAGAEAVAAEAEEAAGEVVTGQHVPELQHQQHNHQQQQLSGGGAVFAEAVGGRGVVQPAPSHALPPPWRPASLPLLLRLDNPLLCLAWDEEEEEEDRVAGAGSEGPVGERSAAVGAEGKALPGGWQSGVGGGRQPRLQQHQQKPQRESVQLQLLSAMVADMMEHMGLPERVHADSQGTTAPPFPPTAPTPPSSSSTTTTTTANGDTRNSSSPPRTWHQLRRWVRCVLGSQRCGYGGGQPAHSPARAVHVTHLLWFMLQATEASRCLQPLPLLALLLGGLLGEAGHPGLTSGFLVAADHPIALRHAGVAAAATAPTSPAVHPSYGRAGIAAAPSDGDASGGGSPGAGHRAQVQVLQAHICEVATEQLLLAAGRAEEAMPGGGGGGGNGGGGGGGGDGSGRRPSDGHAASLSALKQRDVRHLVCRAICASAPGHLSDIMRRVSASLERRQQLAQLHQQLEQQQPHPGQQRQDQQQLGEQQLPAEAAQGAGAGPLGTGTGGVAMAADAAARSLMDAGDPEYVDALLGLALHVALRHGHLLRHWALSRRLSNAAAEELAAQAALELQLGLPPSSEAHGLNPRNQAQRELERVTEEAMPALQLLLCALGGPLRGDATEGHGDGGAPMKSALEALNSFNSIGDTRSGQGGLQLNGLGRDGASAGGVAFGKEGAYRGPTPGAGAGLGVGLGPGLGPGPGVGVGVGAAQAAGVRPGEMLRALFDNLHHNALMWRVVLATQEGSGDVLAVLG